MNRLLKLVHFEVNRFWKIYMVLIGVTIVSQILGAFFTAKDYMSNANRSIYKELMPKETFIEQFGTLSFYNLFQSLWFMGPIGLCASALIIYVFFIWYRDWMGKNTFSYRLLMLPTARLNIYLAKAAAIFLMTIGLMAVQLILILINNQILQRLVPEEFFTSITLKDMTNQPEFMVLFPNGILNFILHYGVGLIAVFVVFTAILFERSYRLKGVFFGVLYGGLSLLIFLAPLLVDEFILGSYFYPNELFLMELGSAILVLVGAIWTGNYLINHKIRA